MNTGRVRGGGGGGCSESATVLQGYDNVSSAGCVQFYYTSFCIVTGTLQNKSTKCKSQLYHKNIHVQRLIAFSD